jgi:hypothetical protein
LQQGKIKIEILPTMSAENYDASDTTAFMNNAWETMNDKF